MDQNLEKTETTQNLQIGEDVFINTKIAIKLLNPKGDLVEKLKEEYDGLIITDFHDRDQIKVVHDAAQVVKKLRAEKNKDIKAVKSLVSKFQKDFKIEGDKILNGLDGIYKTLIETRDDAKQKLADEAHAVEMERLNKYNERANSMFENGYTNNGVQFIVGSIIIEAQGLEEIPNDDFEKILINGKTEFDRIQKLLEEARILKEENEAKLKQEAKDKADAEKLAFEKLDNMSSSNPNPSNATPVALPPIVSDVTPMPVDETVKENDLPFENEPTPFIEPINETLDDDLGSLPEGYALGFEACKHEIKRIFSEAPPMKREDLLKLILDLKAE